MTVVFVILVVEVLRDANILTPEICNTVFRHPKHVDLGCILSSLQTVKALTLATFTAVSEYPDLQCQLASVSMMELHKVLTPESVIALIQNADSLGVVMDFVSFSSRKDLGGSSAAADAVSFFGAAAKQAEQRAARTKKAAASQVPEAGQAAGFTAPGSPFLGHRG